MTFFSSIFIRTKIICTFLIPGMTLAAHELQRPPEKKLIEFGWDAPTPQFLRDNIGEMERNSPYDGVGIALKTHVIVNGKSFEANQYTLTKGIPWQYEWFRNDIIALKKAECRQFKANFLNSCFHGAIDWFDDTAWETTAANFAILARISRETGCRGLMIDTEHYTKERQFSYSGGHSYEETAAMARRRGREIMRAIAGEQPDATLFFFFLFSYNFQAAESSNPQAVLASAEHGLLVPFTNGLYDELPPSMTIVDGCESLGYKAAGPADYYLIYFKTKCLAEFLTAPENLAKMRNQTQLAAATYLDAYFICPPGSNWALKTEARDKLKLLEKNLAIALRISDEYAWTWSEGAKWWPIPYESWQKTTPRGNGMWNRAVPGINQAMRRAKNPGIELEARIAAGTAENLIRNGSFEQRNQNVTSIPAPKDAVSGRIPAWDVWMDEVSKAGCYEAVPGGYSGESSLAAKARNIRRGGCLLQSIPVKPGQKYLVRGKLRTDGNSTAGISVQWRKPDLNWDFAAGLHTLAPQSIPGNEKWRKCERILTVPDADIGYLVILLNAGGQTMPQDQAWFDDIEIYRLD